MNKRWIGMWIAVGILWVIVAGAIYVMASDRPDEYGWKASMVRDVAQQIALEQTTFNPYWFGYSDVQVSRIGSGSQSSEYKVTGILIVQQEGWNSKVEHPFEIMMLCSSQGQYRLV
jgi:hypothetical protein